MSPSEINQSGLPAEPADPQEREQRDLEPKSYADAAQEAVEPKADDNDAIDYSNGNSNGHTTRNADSSKQQNGREQMTRKSSNDTNVGKNLNEDKIVYEKFSNGDGSYLTSVKPDSEYEESLKHNVEVAPRSPEPSIQKRKTQKLQDTPKTQLKSGRKAGAGWEQSA